MQAAETDNFTKVVKYELITKKYSKQHIKLLLYGYFFQVLALNKKVIKFRFNLISDFILEYLSQELNFSFGAVKKRNNTIELDLSKYEQAYKKFVNETNSFLIQLQNNAINRNDFAYFIVGWFLRSGSISNLECSSYHLELKLKAIELVQLITNIWKKYNLHFKSLNRKTHFIFYLKKIDEISDFLKYINAIESMMALEANRIQKDSNNYMQRWENLDLSNALKTSLAINEQIALIKEFKRTGQFDELDIKSKEICEQRLNNKELSLSQLVLMINNLHKNNKYVTKSQIAYLFSKLKKLLKK